MSNPSPKPHARPSLRRDVLCSLAVVALAVAVRAPRLNQSLWLDEMTTLADYVRQPWSKVLAPRAGQYVPNNHVLHTAVAKLTYAAMTGPADPRRPPAEAVLRLPALVAGSLLPVALAWPLRRRAPGAALIVAVVAAVHPWLVDLGTEARGYTLMLLLGVVATNLLATAGAAYVVAVALAIYTVPLAVLLVPAHAVAVAVTGRPAWRRWAVAAAAALLLATALYLPMARGLYAYYRHPYPASDYRTFLDALPRTAFTGDRLPRQHVDPARPPGHDHPPDAPGSAVFWALPVLVAIIGTALAWPRFPDARPLLATLAATTAIGVVLPLAVPGAAEVRFVTWAAPWFCLTVALLLAATAAVSRPLAGAGLVVLLGLMGWWDAHPLPNQPVREALALADRLAPPDGPIVVAYIGAFETTDVYGAAAPGHVLLPAIDAAQLRAAQAEGRAENGRLPWVVILFERMARDRSRADPGTAGLWRELSTHYRLIARLDGRVSPVAVYAPVDDATTAPAVAAGR